MFHKAYCVRSYFSSHINADVSYTTQDSAGHEYGHGKLFCCPFRSSISGTDTLFNLLQFSTAEDVAITWRADCVNACQ